MFSMCCSLPGFNTEGRIDQQLMLWTSECGADSGQTMGFASANATGAAVMSLLELRHTTTLQPEADFDAPYGAAPG